MEHEGRRPAGQLSPGADEDLTPPGSGDFATDLRDWLRRLAGSVGTSDSGAVFRALLAHVQHDPAFAGESGRAVWSHGAGATVPCRNGP
ncbi:TetR-like C-terminal domain-containing protein [Streptomyces sp. NPDC048279]|uniref:TetR-like C-terminal domain-containing protein n=1 Tax=Streptomyces sp. NPDC048279 TaxID=3154714 RepID=UPI003416A95C